MSREIRNCVGRRHPNKQIERSDSLILSLFHSKGSSVQLFTLVVQTLLFLRRLTRQEYEIDGRALSSLLHTGKVLLCYPFSDPVETCMVVWLLLVTRCPWSTSVRSTCTSTWPVCTTWDVKLVTRSTVLFFIQTVRRTETN